VVVVKYILVKICAFLFFRVVKQVTRRVPPNTCFPPGRGCQELKARTRRPGAEDQEDQKARS